MVLNNISFLKLLSLSFGHSNIKLTNTPHKRPSLLGSAIYVIHIDMWVFGLMHRFQSHPSELFRLGSYSMKLMCCLNLSFLVEHICKYNFLSDKVKCFH